MTTNNNQNKPNSGVLFQNKDKKSPNQPDFTGKYYDKDNKEWRVAGWEREKNGNKFISLAFSDPEDFAKGQSKPQGSTQQPSNSSQQQSNHAANNSSSSENDFGSLFDDMEN